MLLFRYGLKLGSAKPEVVDEPYRSLALVQRLRIENEIDAPCVLKLSPWASRLMSTSISVGTWFIKSSRMANVVPLIRGGGAGEQVFYACSKRADAIQRVLELFTVKVVERQCEEGFAA